MINQYPLWKYLLLLLVAVVGGLYALPNLYGEDPAVQISASRGELVDESIREKAVSSLREAGISFEDMELGAKHLLVRFSDTDAQLRAMEQLRDSLGEGFVAALNLAPATPAWLQAMDIRPMFLGLDLRGGVHFLMEVDMATSLTQSMEGIGDEVRSLLRKEKIRYARLHMSEGALVVEFRDEATRGQAYDVVHRDFPDLVLDMSGGGTSLKVTYSEREARELRKFALEQNLIALRNRVNELGVAEPVIQQQGNSRIVVQLPGVQDTAQAKRILGATATLEYRAVDTQHNIQDVLESGHVPAGSEILNERDGTPVLLYKRYIVTGDQITNARSGFDQQNGTPMVSVTLDGQGGKKMLKFTRDNVGKPMAVVFIENKTLVRKVDGEEKLVTKKVREVISVATVRGEFGKQFQTTGLDSSEEAHELALLLRAGALAAPIRIIEERTVGPSLGKENIEQGFKSVLIGFSLVLVFMAVYYRVFGLVANLALTLNLVLIVALLSMLQATLTLPGIAGIVLTVGMAVDANVLIFERIREELRNGNSPQASIHAGYAKAFSTIADANITTLIAAVVLFSFGTGPIKGFAVTLSLGIMTSMLTSIMGTRAVINLIYGRRRVKKLAI